MLVKNIMQKNIVTAAPDINIIEAARIMTDKGVDSIVITKNDRMVGILTDHDILHAIAQYGDSDVKLEDLTVEQMMTRYVITITPGAKVEKAITLMLKHKIKRLPVINDDKLTGLITTTDIAFLEPKIIDILGKLLSKRLKDY